MKKQQNQIFETIKPGLRNGRWANPQVTMNAKGHIKVNRVAFEMLGEPARIRVLFDETTQTIKLAAADPDDENAHVCIAHGHHGEHGGRLIRVYGLMERVEGDLFTCIRFREIRTDDSGRLVLELKKAIPAFNGKRIGVFKEWQAKQKEKINNKAKLDRELRHARQGKRTIEEWREELDDRRRRKAAEKQRLAAERQLAREQRRLEKDRAAREARDKLNREFDAEIARRREELEKLRQLLPR